MKKYLLLIILLVSFNGAFSQLDTAKAPYQRFPTFPAFQLMNTDSSTYFTKADLAKKSPVMLMLFSPDCDHCQHETEDIIKNIDKFKDKKIQIVMATPMPFSSMMAFREKYQLANYSNIFVVHDNKIMLPVFYQLSNMPFLAFYDKKKELISVHRGSLSVEKVLEEFKK